MRLYVSMLKTIQETLMSSSSGWALDQKRDNVVEKTSALLGKPSYPKSKDTTMEQAARFNTNKPHVRYLLSFDEGTWGLILGNQHHHMCVWSQWMNKYLTDVKQGDRWAGENDLKWLAPALFDFSPLGTARNSYRDLIIPVAQIMQYGATKYATHNWRKGLPMLETLDSAIRHLLAMMDGEEIDPVEKGGSGLPHIGHYYTNVMFFLYHFQNNPQLRGWTAVEDEVKVVLEK